MRRIGKFWITLSLATRLTVIFAMGMVVALTLAGTVTVLSLSSYLTNQQDAQLSAAARVMGPNAANLADTRVFSSNMPSDYYIYVQFVDSMNRQDREFITSATKQESGIPKREFLPKKEDIPKISTASSLVMPGTTVPSTKSGQKWRVLSILLTSQGKVAGAATVGLSMTPQRNMIQAIIFTITISTLIIAVIGTLLTNYLVGRAFKPLHEIEDVANKIAAGDLTKRIKNAPATTEVGSLANSLNVMLSNLEQAFSTVELSERKMRRFVSDASHELRTPTAAIRGYAELSRMGGVGPERQAEVMARIESEATRMGNMVQDLLTLARLDEHRPMVFERTDITALARDSLSDMAVLDPHRDLQLLNLEDESVEDVHSVYATVDAEKISQVITNLLTNVRQHTPEGTPVEIAVGYHMWPDETGLTLKNSVANRIPPFQRCVVMEIRDHGPGVAPEDAKKVFERFYRSDTSRVRTTGGTGLGLAIVSGIVSAHNGTVAMIPTPGGGATVRIKLPCQASHVESEMDSHSAQVARFAAANAAIKASNGKPSSVKSRNATVSTPRDGTVRMPRPSGTTSPDSGKAYVAKTPSAPAATVLAAPTPATTPATTATPAVKASVTPSVHPPVKAAKKPSKAVKPVVIPPKNNHNNEIKPTRTPPHGVEPPPPPPPAN